MLGLNQAGRVVRILMVDDDPHDIFLTKAAFRKLDLPFELTALKSADDLMGYIRDNGVGDIDILLLDSNMHCTNGLQTLKMLQEYPHYEDLNVFMFSTFINEADKQACLRAGARGAILKSSSLSQMKDVAKQIFQSLDAQKISTAHWRAESRQAVPAFMLKTKQSKPAVSLAS